MRGVDGHDVPVAGHRPVSTVQRAVTEVHRIVAPQPREEAVPGVFGIEVRVADVDLVERHRPGIAICLGLKVDPAPHRGDIVHRSLLPCSCAGMPTINERDVRPMKIAFEFPTCQRRRGGTPKSANRVVKALEEGEDLRGPLGRLLERRPVPAVVEEHEADRDADLEGHHRLNRPWIKRTAPGCRRGLDPACARGAGSIPAPGFQHCR